MSTSVEVSTNTSSGYVLGNFNAIGGTPVAIDGTICFFWNVLAFGGSFTLFDWAAATAPFQGISTVYVDRGFGNQLTFTQYTSSGTIAQHTTLIPVVNTWYFLAFTMSNGNANVYYKKVGAPSCTLWQGLATTGAATSSMAIGNTNNLNGANQARFAGFKWWTGRILSQSEIEVESRQISVASPEGLWGYWALDNQANVWSTQPVGGPLMLGTFSGNYTFLSQKAGPPIPIVGIHK